MDALQAVLAHEPGHALARATLGLGGSTTVATRARRCRVDRADPERSMSGAVSPMACRGSMPSFGTTAPVFRSSAQRRLALDRFIGYYNEVRPRLGIDGRTSRQRLSERLAD
jgi:hypothetical protein